jgi:hypothetical protein
MIDAQAGIAGKSVPEIFPEGIDPLARMQRAQRVRPALRHKLAIGFAHLRPKQRVIDPALRRIHIERGRHHVEVARQDDRRAALQHRFGVARQPLEPVQLVIEFRAGSRIAVGQIEASDKEATDRRFNIAAVGIVPIAGQTAAGLDRRGAPREDRDAVPAFLPMPDRVIAGRVEHRRREFLVGRFQFLQAHDIRLRFRQPTQQIA